MARVHIAQRIAAAPISWGVCEVAGWGHQLDPARVLAEMQSVGIEATELGPEGFLPQDPDEAAGLLAAHGLRVIAGFAAVRLNDGGGRHLEVLREAVGRIAASGAHIVVLAVTAATDGYDSRPHLDAAGWRSLLANLEASRAAAVDMGVDLVVHPHVGTMIETPADVRRVLEGTSVSLCLDTGHLVIGGADPVELARSMPGRIAHVHLKDLDGAWADKVRSGQVSYSEAVRAGMFLPLGAGDAGIRGVIEALEASGYGGWYVLEQDTMLGWAPRDDRSPLEEVRASLQYLGGLVGDSR